MPTASPGPNAAAPLVAPKAAAEGWRPPCVDRGRLVQAFLAQGLIEDVVPASIPVLLGEGLPLSGPGAQTALVHAQTCAVAPGLVPSRSRAPR